MRPETRLYLVLNLVGSAILAVLAAYEVQWGFLLLEVCWAIVSAFSLVQQLRSGGGRDGCSGRTSQSLPDDSR